MNVDTTYLNPPVADIDGPLRTRADRRRHRPGRLRASASSSIATTSSASWLVAYMLFLGIALGSLALMMIQHLSGGAWGVFRRIFEASSRTLPLLAVLFLPVAARHDDALSLDARRITSQHDEVLRHKAPYLNTPFFLVRARDLLRRLVGHRVRC